MRKKPRLKVLPNAVWINTLIGDSLSARGWEPKEDEIHWDFELKGFIIFDDISKKIIQAGPFTTVEEAWIKATEMETQCLN